MKRDRHSDADKMSLPDGKTCGDCVYFLRCFAFYGHIAGDEVCDWAPSRFSPRAALAAQVPQQGEA
ncbi:hypothetical protein E2544_08615 [Achromobacter insolitus]|nr:hypothetical protein E2544_08615 [Achromobacter insolitus]